MNVCNVGNIMVQERGELSNTGHFTTLEALLLKSIVVYFIVHGFEVSVPNFLYVYHKIHSVSLKCDSIDFPLFVRNVKCVELFLRRIFNILELLKSLLNIS